MNQRLRPTVQKKDSSAIRKICFLVLLCLIVGRQSGFSQPQGDEVVASATRLDERLPEAPDGFYPTEIGDVVAGMVHARITETRAADDGREYPVTVEVGYSFLGDYKSHQTVSFSWDSAAPPSVLGEPSVHPSLQSALCVFDKNNTLLLVSYHHYIWSEAVPGVIATSRSPSKRYSRGELKWAWLAWFHHYNQDQFRDYVTRAWRKDRLPPGLMELYLRFASPNQKLELLSALRSGRKPSRDELDVIQLCLWDAQPTVQAEAAHLLLDYGRAVDQTPLRQTLNPSQLSSYPPRYESRYVLGPLVRMGDEEAKQILLKLLEKGHVLDSSHTVVLEQAAVGPPDLLSHIRRHVQEGLGSSIFAWLRLGGSAKEAVTLRGDISRIDMRELARVGNFEALPLLLQRFQYKLEKHEWIDDEDVAKVAQAIARLRPQDAQRVREVVIPALRNCLDLTEKYRPHLLAILTSVGDEEALSELERMSWKDARYEILPVANTIGDTPNPRVVKILVTLLLRARQGWSLDCTSQSSQTVALITKILSRRSQEEREMALALLDREISAPLTPSSDLFYMHWALGERPAPSQLSQLGSTWTAEQYDVSLEGHEENYAFLLPLLRQNPRQHWAALERFSHQCSANCQFAP